MKPGKFREMSDEELKEKIYGIQEEIFNLRFQQSSGEAKNPLRIRELRRDVARVKTILNERSKGINIGGK